MCNILKHLIDNKSIIVGSNNQNLNAHPTTEFQLAMGNLKEVYSCIQYIKRNQTWHYPDAKTKCLQT